MSRSASTSPACRGYYLWKALLPLYLLTTLSMGTFHFEIDKLSDRCSTVSTFFLAAFAMLYVVGAALPKTDFLTKIDTVIVVTTASLVFTGNASLALAKMNKEFGADVADDWNLSIEVSLISMYVLANLCISMPPCSKQWQAAGGLQASTEFRHRGLRCRSAPDRGAGQQLLHAGGCKERTRMRIQ